MDWLSHSSKKHCELCKAPFRFTKQFDAAMPDILPWRIFAYRATAHLARHVLVWLRVLLVLLIWLVIVPASVRYAWRGVFYITDLDWVLPFDQAVNATISANGLEPDSFAVANSTGTIVPSAMHPVLHAVALCADKFFGIDVFGLSSSDDQARARTSLLSGLMSSRYLTSSATTNRAIIDIFEGQLILVAVIISFVSIALIREWVVQQQPLIHAAADLDHDHVDFVPVRVPIVEQQVVEPTVPAAPSPGAQIDARPHSSDGSHTGHNDGSTPLRLRPEMITRNSSHSAHAIRRSLEEGISPASSPADFLGSGQSRRGSHATLRLIIPSPSEHGDSATDFDPWSSASYSHTSPDFARSNTTDAPSALPDLAPSSASVFSDGLSSNNHDNGQTTTDTSPNEAPTTSLMQATYNVFWGELDAGSTPNENGDRPAQGHDVVNEPHTHDTHERLDSDQGAPVVGGGHHHDHNHDHQPNHDHDHNHIGADQAAALDFDADDIEAADDMQGVLELIGMDGPLLHLVQTSTFSAAFLAVTLWAAIGIPYTFGKVVLIVLSEPILFLVIVPLHALTFVADGIIDFAKFCLDSLALCIGQTLGVLSSLPLTSAVNVIEANAARLVDWASSDMSRILARWFTKFVFDTGEYNLRTGLISASIQTHLALRTMQTDFRAVTQACKWAVRATFACLSDLEHVDFRSVLRALLGSITLQNVYSALARSWHLVTNLTLTTQHASLTETDLQETPDSFRASDRVFIIFLGYCFLGMLGAALTVQRQPLFSNANLQALERNIAELIRQIGSIVKVVIIIAIELFLFPLYCGTLLDAATLPLWADSTFNSRFAYAQTSPYTSIFLHWFMGMAYTLSFASFVSMCRRLLRRGVLNFIRAPEDPDFHPVRDVLERNVSMQIMRISVSAAVYGVMILLGLGGTVWGLAHFGFGVLPLRWSSPDPILEFPLAVLLCHLATPLMLHHIEPVRLIEDKFDVWLRYCAEKLRLSHFMFGNRVEEQETEAAHSRWASRFFPAPVPGTEGSLDRKTSGQYMRVPASNHVRFQNGGNKFVSVTKAEVDKSEAQQACEQHGNAEQDYRNIYIPPHFRARIGLFCVGLWALCTTTVLSVTLLPLLIGRIAITLVLPGIVTLNDTWAFLLGLMCVLLVASLGKSYRSTAWRERTGQIRLLSLVWQDALTTTTDHALCALKCAYVYGTTSVLLPLCLMIAFELYIALPFQTIISLIWTPSLLPQICLNKNNPAFIFRTPYCAAIDVHPLMIIIWAAPHFILGIVFVFMVFDHEQHVEHALLPRIVQRITRAGFHRPDYRLATRAIIFPTLAICVAATTWPLCLAIVVDASLPAILPWLNVPRPHQVLVYRFSYPFCAAVAFAIYGAYNAKTLLEKWRAQIKDEVYLVGERLHNFGEAEPPVGSKSVSRPVVETY